MSSLRADHRRVDDLAVSDDVLRLWLEDGRTLTVPLHWFPRLCDGTAAERNDWERSDSGSLIRWPSLDVSIGVPDLLADSPLNGAGEPGYARVDDLHVSDDALCLWLEDGRTLTVPLHWFPRLCDGTAAERNDWERSDSGSLIRWPHLDEDLTVDGLLGGGWSAEGAKTLGSWLLARREGRSAKHLDIVTYRRSRPRPVPLA